MARKYNKVPTSTRTEAISKPTTSKGWWELAGAVIVVAVLIVGIVLLAAWQANASWLVSSSSSPRSTSISIPITSSRPTSPEDFIQTHGLFSQKQEAVDLPPGWVTVLEIPPGSVGKVVSIWYTGNTGGMQAAFRATANQADVPQFGGVSGINVEGLCGPGWDGLISQQANINDVWMHTEHFTYNYHYDGNHWISCTFMVPMPFTDGFLLEFNSGVAGVTRFYSIMEYTLGEVVDDTVDWVLYAEQSPTPTGGVTWNSVAFLQEWVLWSVIGARTEYFGSWIWLSSEQCSSAGNQLGFMEGDLRFYSDSPNGAPTWQSSGTEDYVHSSFYDSDWHAAQAAGLSPTIFAFDWYGYPVAQSQAQGCKQAFYKFYKKGQRPYAENNNTFTWQNGDNAVGGMPGTYDHGVSPYDCPGCTAAVNVFNLWYQT